MTRVYVIGDRAFPAVSGFRHEIRVTPADGSLLLVEFPWDAPTDYVRAVFRDACARWARGESWAPNGPGEFEIPAPRCAVLRRRPGGRGGGREIAA